MHRAIWEAQNNHLFAVLSGETPDDAVETILFNVNRETIVADAIREINSYETEDLWKPLKVKFLGEDAEDAGGVRKEFFLLLIKEILDRKYGMFQEYEESRMIWFHPNSFEDSYMYELVGTICGLAIHNMIVINLPFPLHYTQNY